MRHFHQLIIKEDKSLIDHLKIEKLLSIFFDVVYAYQMVREMEHADPLPYFSDMLDEKYLWSQEYNEEEDEIRYEEGPFSDDLFYSFYDYSFQVILTVKPLIIQYQNICQNQKTRKYCLYLSENL